MTAKKIKAKLPAPKVKKVVPASKVNVEKVTKEELKGLGIIPVNPAALTQKPLKTVEVKAKTAPRVHLLDNWMELSAEVKTMKEDEAFCLLEAERASRCRPNVILRLHGRYNRMRGERERMEMMQPLKKSTK